MSDSTDQLDQDQEVEEVIDKRPKIAPAKTGRISMVWPPELKEKVREKAGPRGMTEYIIDATEKLMMEEDGTYQNVAADLRRAREFAQHLANIIVLPGPERETPEEALKDVDLPPWLNTQGWPAGLAKRVHTMQVTTVPTEDAKTKTEANVKVAKKKAEPKSEKPEREELSPAGPPPTSGVLKTKDDFFERVMSKAGGAEIADSLKDKLKPASQIQAPVHKEAEPEPESEKTTRPSVATCPDCGEELVDGECWTCL